MTLTRRELLLAAGGALLAVNMPTLASDQPEMLIEMLGTARGERVWFDPLGVAVKPGTTLKKAGTTRHSRQGAYQIT